MTRFFPVTIDQPDGIVKVAPPGVTRGVSAEMRSGADFYWAAEESAALANVAVSAKKL